MRGKTIMPGIVDVHAHVGGEGDGILAQSSWPLLANLAFGVTTSHYPSNDSETVFSNAELIRAGAKLGPRLFSTGSILYGAETPFKAISNYEMRFRICGGRRPGAFSVKSYNQQRRDARQMIIKAARELQMMVVPEGGSLLYMNETMILDGHTGIEHSLPVPAFTRTSSTSSRREDRDTPTLIVGYGGLSGSSTGISTQRVGEQRLLTSTPRDDRRQVLAPPADDAGRLLQPCAASRKGAKQFLDAGGSVQLARTGSFRGWGALGLWMLQQRDYQSGGDPVRHDRRREVPGLDRELGLLEKGKLADLIVLYLIPLEGIRNTESVGMVMLNGRLYDAKTLNQIGNHPKPNTRRFGSTNSQARAESSLREDVMSDSEARRRSSPSSAAMKTPWRC